jgi:hypothetical protein
MSTITVTPTIEADTTEAKIGKRGQEILARMREIGLVEKAARDLEAEKKELAAELMTITKGAKYATFQGVKAATRIDSKSKKVNDNLLAEAFPEAYAACVTFHPYSYYRQA